jgi:hypothetical protein
MKRLFILLSLFIALGSGSIVGRFLALDSEPPSLFLARTPSPDPKVFAAVLDGLEKAHTDSEIAWGKRWVLHTDPQNGVIESDWFEEHKGEVHFKVQVAVWGKHWHVDVWEHEGVPIWPDHVTKKDWSRRFERQIQSHIDDSVREQF